MASERRRSEPGPAREEAERLQESHRTSETGRNKEQLPSVFRSRRSSEEEVEEEAAYRSAAASRLSSVSERRESRKSTSGEDLWRGKITRYGRLWREEWNSLM